MRGYVLNRKLQKIVSVILSLMMIFSCCGCQKEPEPEDIMKKLETAFNTANIEMMLECYEPSVQNMYKGMMEIGGALLGGVDLATIVSGLGGFADIFGSEFGAEMPKIEIVVNSKKVLSDSKVILNVTQKYDYKGIDVPKDTPTELTEDVYFVKIDGEWYISAKPFKD